jgi:hypothetical protein
VSLPRSFGASTGPGEELIDMAGKFIKGALIEFMPTFLVPVPNVIAFQFNPDTMMHTWSQPTEDAAQPATDADTPPNPLIVKGDPGESFTFSLAMDSDDTIAHGSPFAVGLAKSYGLYPRLAALEMLQYPVPAKGKKLVGSFSAMGSVAGAGLAASTGMAGGVSGLGTMGAFAVGLAIGGILAAPKTEVPQSQLPTVLFVWGQNRALPVRVKELTITEKAYDTLLNPIHVDADITLEVLKGDELGSLTGPLAGLAKAACDRAQEQRRFLAAGNLANTVDSVVGMFS